MKFNYFALAQIAFSANVLAQEFENGIEIYESQAGAIVPLNYQPGQELPEIRGSAELRTMLHLGCKNDRFLIKAD